MVRRAIVASIPIHHGCRVMDKYICVIAGSYDEVRVLSERTGITARYITMPNIDSLLREVALRGFGVVNV